ncbi:MAG TPA: siderophore biosynthesis protein [Streptosporangiaceae bacterium]|nr:siderophore biosynthesis protein [Streptosporangiaceae bacterium]
MPRRRLYVVAGKVTDSVTYGFLPAADRLGLDVTVLTDRPAEHERTYPRRRIVACDVTDFRDIVNTVRAPDAIFSNSDHLQAPTALAAAYFGLPGKDWRAATRTKNKALMRRHLGDGGYVAELGDPHVDLAGAPFPLVLKPREGVASEDVVLVADSAELAARAAEIGHRRPLMVEEYLPGGLHTLETIGDGRELRVLGSFRTTLSPPPYFVEERLEWAPPPPESGQVLDQLRALGVGFGTCHTEFVVHAGRARLIEVNYRNIGDHCDFLLADLLGLPLFDDVLRLHLGEPLSEPPHARNRHAIVEYVLAGRSGTLTAAPEPGERVAGGVRVTYRPQRPVGSAVALSHTNRDYLGTIAAIGPDPAAVAATIACFRAEHVWEIT